MNDLLTADELRDLDAIVASTIEPVAPPPFLKQQLLGAIAGIPQNSHTVRDEEGRWLDVVRGVQMKKLSRDPQRGTVTLLLRFQAGASLPAHDHRGAE